VGQDLPSCRSQILLYQRKSCITIFQRSSSYRASTVTTETNTIQHLRAYQVITPTMTTSCVGCFLQYQGHDVRLFLLQSRSLRSFEEVSDTFNQFASQQEFKKNINHLLTDKMKQERISQAIHHLFSEPDGPGLILQ